MVRRYQRAATGLSSRPGLRSDHEIQMLDDLGGHVLVAAEAWRSSRWSWPR